jgi:hypothetical protein
MSVQCKRGGRLVTSALQISSSSARSSDKSGPTILSSATSSTLTIVIDNTVFMVDPVNTTQLDFPQPEDHPDKAASAWHGGLPCLFGGTFVVSGIGTFAASGIASRLSSVLCFNGSAWFHPSTIPPMPEPRAEHIAVFVSV